MASMRTPHTCSRVLESNWKNCVSRWSQCPERHAASIHEQIPPTSHPASSKSNQTTVPHSTRSCRTKHSKSNQSDDKESGSFLVQQFKNASRIRDGVSNMINGFVSVEQPGKWFSDCQRYLPFSIKIKTTVIQKNESTHPVEIEKTQKMNEKHRILGSEIAIREQHSLETHIQDTNDGIGSYYDVTPLTEDKNLNAGDSIVHASKTTDEEFSMWQLLFSKAAAFGLASADLPDGKPKTKVEKKPVIRKDFVSRTALASRTLALVHALKLATSNISRLKRAEDLSAHLLQYPECRAHAVKEKVLPCLLKMSKSKDWTVTEKARELLALVGYVPPVRGQGIRVLTIDGGGTRGLNAIECMKKLEEACNTKIYELFDYVCGSSTGALIVAMVFLHRVSLKDTEHLYKEFSEQMFTRNKLVGTGNLVWSHAFYDTEQWEKILKDNIGENRLIEFARDPLCPKMSALSTLMNVPKLKNYMFRNYNHQPGVFSHYPGNCRHRSWEVIRASSAAPGYYEEFRLGDMIHQDGGLLTNNPTALAIHECKLLWPEESIQSVISLGTGRYEPNLEFYPNKSSLKDKVNKIVDSATDTEAVHITLQDTLPPSVYFRFNPYLSEEFMLDEIRPDKVKQMQLDSQMYLRKNERKIEMAAQQTLLPRRYHQKAMDWIKLQGDML
ncbi:hypothetical protein ScPMuIL_008194 [Solemya velum]